MSVVFENKPIISVPTVGSAFEEVAISFLAKRTMKVSQIKHAGTDTLRREVGIFEDNELITWQSSTTTVAYFTLDELTFNQGKTYTINIVSPAGTGNISRGDKEAALLEEPYHITLLPYDSEKDIPARIEISGLLLPVEVVTVSFDSTGGTFVPSVTLPLGESVKEPSLVPALMGYTFSGWQLNGVAYNFNTPVIADLTLQAVWIPLPPAPPIVVGVVEPKANQALTVEQVTLTNPNMRVSSILIETNDPNGNRFILKYMCRSGHDQYLSFSLATAGTLHVTGLAAYTFDIQPQSPVSVHIEKDGSVGSVYFAKIGFVNSCKLKRCPFW